MEEGTLPQRLWPEGKGRGPMIPQELRSRRLQPLGPRSETISPKAGSRDKKALEVQGA